ncbi:SRPBCC domain-containing protein [Cohnella suwonensis]|uniref:SRPBCC domain-containing protein n=1 Tax=Cohnella suwonensis TaxID=696072 RepID=A0ABW0LQV4_9BACL
MSEHQAATSEFVISRTFNAPRDLVFKAWSEAEHLQHWWGPKGLAISVATLDFRPGGTFHYCMKAPDGNEMWGKFVYREIVPAEKIVFVNSFSDPEGNIVRPPFLLTFPLEVLNVLTFDEQDGKTTLTLRGGPINATEDELKLYESMHDSMQQGFTGTFDQLEEHLAKA